MKPNGTKRTSCEARDTSITGRSGKTEEHPKVYKSIQPTFRITGKEVQEDKVKEAIELSQEKYSGVTAMLRAYCPIT